MTVSTTANKAQFNGSGSTGPFTFNFRFFDNTDISVIKTVSDVDTTLLETTDYTLTGAGDYSGGSVTLVTALAVGESLTIYRSLTIQQLTDLRNQGAFFAETHEDVFDRLTMVDQQQKETIDRTLKLSISASGSVSKELPPPASNMVIGWDNTGAALKNWNVNELVTIGAYGTASADVFTGDGSTTDFTLSFDPANVNNLDVSIGGVTQIPTTDYTWTSGTTVTFTTAPPNGETILVRYMRALAQGTMDWGSVSGKPVIDTQVYINDDTTISDPVIVIDGGGYVVASGKTLTFSAQPSAGLYQIFSGSGSVTGLTVAYPEWFGTTAAAFKAAVDSLPAAGGVVKLQDKTYLSPYVDPYDSSKYLGKDNVKIVGSKQPSHKTDFTALEGGTIILGNLYIRAHNIELSDFGVDVGSASGLSGDALAIYDISNGIYWRGFRARNISTICSAYDTPYHAALFEHLDGAVVSNISTVYGLHGIVTKTINSVFSDLKALGSSQNGLIIKAPASGGMNRTTFDGVYIGSTTGTNGGGIRFTAQEGITLSDISMTNVIVKACTYGINLYSTASDLVENVTISNFNISGCNGVGIPINGIVSDVTFSDGFVNNCANDGINTSASGTNVRFINVNASSNSGVGFNMYGVNEVLLSCVASNNTSYGFYTHSTIGTAVTYKDLCTGTGNVTALDGADGYKDFYTLSRTTTYAPTLINSWVRDNVANSTPQYWKDSTGKVHLQGLVKNGTAGQPIMQLPSGFRPGQYMRFPTLSNNAFATILIAADGNVYVETGAATGPVSLDGISFLFVP